MDGVEGAGAGFECVLTAAGGCVALDLLLLDFGALETAAGVFDAEFTVLAVVGAECVLALVPAGCLLELPDVAEVFLTGEDAALEEDTGCALATAALATGGDFAGVAFTAGRTSSDVDSTISTGAAAGGGAAVDDVDAVATGACAGVTAAVGGATLAATGTIAGAELGAMLAGAGAATAVRACAFAAACARLAALAGVLLLASSSGGKFGKVLSGT